MFKRNQAKQNSKIQQIKQTTSKTTNKPSPPFCERKICFVQTLLILKFLVHDLCCWSYILNFFWSGVFTHAPMNFLGILQDAKIRYELGEIMA